MLAYKSSGSEYLRVQLKAGSGDGNVNQNHEGLRGDGRETMHPRHACHGGHDNRLARRWPFRGRNPQSLSVSRTGRHSGSARLRGLASRRDRSTPVRVKLLVDMNLSPQWVGVLIEAGFEAVHW